MTEQPKSDVIVVGAGLMGCATAFRLSQAGKKVTIVEMRTIASGASGRNGGMVMQLDGRDSDPAEMRKRTTYTFENNNILDGLPQLLGEDFGHYKCGSLDIACTDEEADLLEHLVEIQHKDGDEEIEFLDRKALQKLSPVMSDRCLAARFRPSDGCLDPIQLTHAYAKAAMCNGAAFQQRTKVEEILMEGEAATGVRTEQCCLHADAVVVVTNAWVRQLLPELPIFPLRSLAVLTEPLPPVPAITFEAELDGQIVYGATQTPNGNILVGGPPEAPATVQGQYQEQVSLPEIVTNTAVLTELFPVFEGVSVIRAWSGAMAIAPDGLPCIGRVPGKQNLYVVAGFPNGMAFGSIVGKLAAELVVEGEGSLPTDVFDPERFAGVQVDWPERYNYTVLAEFLARK